MIKFQKRLSSSVSRAALAAVCMTSIGASGTVYAQDQEEDVLLFEEVVITAQKRSENLQDVPVAITGLGESRINDSGFDEVSDLQLLVPSLQFSNFGPVAFVSMRGVGFDNTTAGGDPSVTLHLDDVYIGRPVGTLFTAFDTQRVEALRGPQGTLYGRNATGGAINLITKKPEEDFSGKVDASVGNYDSFRLRGAVNMPVSDTLQTRVVGFVQGRKGFTENTIETGTDGNDNDGYGVRLHVAAQLAESVDILLSANYVKSKGVGSLPELREPYPAGGTPLPGFGAGVYDGLINDQDAFIEAKNAPESTNNDLFMLSAALEWEFGNFTAKSITAYVDTSFNSALDNDASPVDISVLNLVEEGDQWTQEFHLASNFDGKFNFITGVFYFKSDAFRTSFFTGAAFDRAINPNISYGVEFYGEVEAESYAGFLHTTYEVSDDLTLTAGARLTRDTKDGLNIFTSTAIGGPPFKLMPTNSVATTEPTWRLSADYKVNDEVMLYAAYSRGYKSGGINGASPVGVGGLPDNGGPGGKFDPEFIDAYEVGMKSTLFDGRMQFNLAAFYSDYSDLQFQVFAPLPAADNAGNAKIYGLEAEWQIAPSERIRIDGNLSLLDTEYKDLLFTTPGGVVDLSGNKLNRSPGFTFTTGANYFFQTSDDFGEVYIRADFNYTGSQYYSPFNRAGDKADSFTNTNLRMFYVSPDEAYEIELYASNIFDTVQEGSIFRGIGFMDEPGGGGQEFVTYNPPRQVGVRLGLNF